MTITLNDEQTRFLAEVVVAGAAQSPEEAVDKALPALHTSVASKPVYREVDILADLFARSPFRGLNIEFERDGGGEGRVSTL